MNVFYEGHEPACEESYKRPLGTVIASHVKLLKQAENAKKNMDIARKGQDLTKLGHTVQTVEED